MKPTYKEASERIASMVHEFEDKRRIEDVAFEKEITKERFVYPATVSSMDFGYDTAMITLTVRFVLDSGEEVRFTDSYFEGYTLCGKFTPARVASNGTPSLWAQLCWLHGFSPFTVGGHFVEGHDLEGKRVNLVFNYMPYEVFGIVDILSIDDGLPLKDEIE